MSRLFVVAFLAVGLLANPSPASADAVIDADGVDVVWVDLATDGGPVSQGAPAAGAVDQSHARAEVVSITVEDDGLRSLQVLPGSVAVENVTLPADLTGVAASENGSQTASSSPEFAAAASRVMSSADLRDYVRSDGLSRPDGGWGADYDVRFSSPIRSNQYLLIHERHGNAEVRLRALDAGGKPLNNAPVVVLQPGSGWNTGYAPADLAEPQPVHLTVLDIDRVLAGTGTSLLHGLRIDNNDEADINLTPMGEEAVALPTLPAASAELTTASTDQDLTFAKTVYVGHDDGVGCGSAATYAEANPTDQVTYCFTVTNNSADFLDAVTITDPFVSGPIVFASADSDPLAPGHSARFYVEAVPPADDADGAVDETYVNTASVAAVRVDAGGVPVPSADPATASARATVFPPEEVPTPGLQLSITVYAGVNGGIGCPAADLTLVDDGDPITYCYTVTNIGNTYLDAILFDQFEIDGDPIPIRADSSPLAPGDSAFFYLDANAPALPPEGLVVTSSAIANSVDESGADLAGVDDATGADGTEIKILLPTPAGPTEAPASQTSGPDELAFTGWGTWVIAIAGVGLIAGGWALVQETSFRQRTLPVRTKKEDRPS